MVSKFLEEDSLIFELHVDNIRHHLVPKVGDALILIGKDDQHMDETPLYDVVFAKVCNGTYTVKLEHR